MTIQQTKARIKALGLTCRYDSTIGEFRVQPTAGRWRNRGYGLLHGQAKPVKPVDLVQLEAQALVSLEALLARR